MCIFCGVSEDSIIKTQNKRQVSGEFLRYLPISEELFSSPLFITSAGRASIGPGENYPPEGHPDLYQFKWEEGRILPEFSLLWVESGSGVWETRQGSLPIQAGQVGMVISGQWHRYRPVRATGWTESWVQFNGRLAHELEESGLLPRSMPVCTPVLPQRFGRHFQELLADIASPVFFNNAFQGLRLLGMLGLLDPSAGPTPMPELDLIERARQHIWSHSHRQLNVAEVAEHLGVSRRTLERTFSVRNLPGVLDEITRCRLNRAERLLRETRLPIQHIVSLSGFGTAEQMRLHFQARHGISPGVYRKAAAGKFPNSLS